jgi:hypothetical protein
MNKRFVRIDFSDFENDELDEAGDVIEEQLTVNIADFPALTVPLATYSGRLSTFSTILGKAIYPEKTADLKTARKALETALRKNGVYINELADGNEVLLAKSGYPLTKERTPVGPLSKATFKKIVSSMGGFDVELDPIPNAKQYILCAMPTEDLLNGSKAIANKYSKWPWYASSTTKFKITDLDNSKKYTMVSVAVGTDPTLTFSDPIERTTQ